MSKYKQCTMDSFFNATKSERRKMKRRFLSLKEKKCMIVNTIDLTIDEYIHDSNENPSIRLSPSKKSKSSEVKSVNVKNTERTSPQLPENAIKKQINSEHIEKINEQSLKIVDNQIDKTSEQSLKTIDDLKTERNEQFRTTSRVKIEKTSSNVFQCKPICKLKYDLTKILSSESESDNESLTSSVQNENLKKICVKQEKNSIKEEIIESNNVVTGCVIKKNIPVCIKQENCAIKEEIVENNNLVAGCVIEKNIPVYIQQENNTIKEVTVEDSKVVGGCSNTPIVAEINHENEISDNINYDNFVRHLNIMIDEIIHHKEFKLLLTENQNEICNKLKCLTFKESKLCIRLFYRKLIWYRTEYLLADKKLLLNLDSTEMSTIIKKLTEYEFINVHIENESIQNLLELLNLKELNNIMKLFKIKSKISKRDGLIARIIKNTKEQKMIFGDPVQKLKKEVCKILGTCFKLNDTFVNFLIRIHLLYGITEHKTPQELHWFMIEFLRKPIKNRIPFKIDCPKLFQSELEFSEYEKYRFNYEKLLSSLENKDNITAMKIILLAFEKYKECIRDEEYLRYLKEKPSFLRKFSCLNCVVSILSEGITILKQENRKTSQHTTKNSDQLLIEDLLQKHFNSNKLVPQNICEILDELLTQNIFRTHKKPEWLKEKILILKNIDINLAAEKFIDAMKDEKFQNCELTQIYFNDEIKSFTKCEQMIVEAKNLKFRVSVDKFPSITISAVEMPDNMPGRKKLYKSKDENGQNYRNVEEVAIEYYRNYYSFEDGIHCEGALLSTLYDILFWDLIYEFYVPNTFISSIQSRPLDMYSIHFYTNRKDAIDGRLNQIGTWTIDEFETEITKVLERISNYITASTYSDITLLMTFVKCMKRDVLVKILRKLVEQHGTYRAGFPDLILWDTQHKKCKFVEVKGQKDKLRPKQILWLRFLLSIGADAELCHVHTTGYNG